MKVWFLIGLVFLVLPVVSAIEYCSQDLPTDYTICADGTGEINYLPGEPGFIYTYLPPQRPYIEFNYTKPSRAGNQTLWEVEYGWNFSSNAPYHYNISIPQECWDASPDFVNLHLWSNYDYCVSPPGNGTCDTPQSGLQCFNGTDFIDFGVISTATYYCREFDSYNVSTATLVFDKVWYEPNGSSYAYFTDQMPTRFWMNEPLFWNTPSQACAKPSYLWEQRIHWELLPFQESGGPEWPTGGTELLVVPPEESPVEPPVEEQTEEVTIPLLSPPPVPTEALIPTDFRGYYEELTVVFQKIFKGDLVGAEVVKIATDYTAELIITVIGLALLVLAGVNLSKNRRRGK